MTLIFLSIDEMHHSICIQLRSKINKKKYGIILFTSTSHLLREVCINQISRTLART